MTHNHIHGVCIRPEEAWECTSMFKVGDGLKSDFTVPNKYNDPEFGFDTTAALSDPGDDAIRAGIAHSTEPFSGKYVDIRSSGPTPEFLAEQKRWYHSGERGFDDTKREDLKEEFEVQDIADLDKTDFEDGYNRAYDDDCYEVTNPQNTYDPRTEIPVPKALVRETAGKLYEWSREMDDYFLTQGVLHPVATGLRVLVAQLYGAIGP